MAMNEWKQIKLSVNEILLDPKNPRMHMESNNPSQEMLISQLLEHHKVFDLCKSIQKHGLFPGEDLLYVILSENKYFVIEGNRRLAAIKLLLDPSKAPKKDIPRISKLSGNTNLDNLIKIPVVIAPNRDSIAPYLIQRHTSTDLEKWSPIMQAQYYHDLINRGYSIQDIIEDTGKTNFQILEFLKNFEMYEIACLMEYNEMEKAILFDRDSFPLTILERVINNKEMIEFLGLSFDSDGKFSTTVKRDLFKKIYQRIIIDIVNKKINTRNLNTASDFSTYIKDLKASMGILTPEKATSPFDKNDFIPSSEQATTGSKTTSQTPTVPTARPPKPQSTRRTCYAIPTSLSFKFNGAASLRMMFEELRKLNYKNLPNTASVMLRIFTEKSLRMYLKKNNINHLVVKESGITIEKKVYELTFGEILDVITSKNNQIIKDESIKKTIRSFKNSSEFESLQTLNSIIHNEEFSVSEKNYIEDIWPKLEGFIRLILKEPNEK